ncbi:FAD-dependent oxidoreductase [soil metagenome]
MITDLRTESPFWLMRNGYLKTYESLSENIKTDFAIIGGGISGALLAWRLTREGASVSVVDRRHIGMGSTCASTALLQYDIDRALHELIDLMGEKKAVRAYKLSLKALCDLISQTAKLEIHSSCEQRSGLRFAKFKKDVGFLEKEFKARRRHGFDVEFWEQSAVENHFPFSSPAALYTGESAIADPFRMTHAFLQDAISAGAKVFDKTEIKNIERLKKSVVLHTSDGKKINASKIIIACGYEAVNFVPFKIGKLASTYCAISEPLPTKEIWFENCNFWNTDDPYNYGRTTTDNRIIFGGEDEPFYNPSKRDKLLSKKTEKLRSQFKKMFPDLPFKVDYSWGGTFIETDDGLPYIGSIKQLSHTYFALGYGGNGITFSQLAADILADLLLGRKNKDAEIFSFDRKTD